MTSEVRLGKFENLQILRGAAALNVVLFHSIGRARGYGMEPELFAPLAGWGMNGVDIFFVLSGFIMVYSQLGRGVTPGRFLLNRVVRIVPVYWAMTSLFLILLLAVPGVFREAEFNLERAIASFLFLTQAVYDTSPFVGLGWTLEFEMLFYVIFALGLCLRQVWLSILFVFVALIALHVLFGLRAIVFEFLIGISIGWILHTLRPSQIVFQGAFVIGCVLFLSSIPVRPDLTRWILWGIPAGLIVFGAIGIRQVQWKLGKLLGDASYSIYLIQVFTIPFAFKSFSLTGLADLHADILVLVSVCFTAICGVIAFMCFERPVIGMGRQIFGFQKRPG